MTDTSIRVGDFAKWKSDRPRFEDCENPERGTKICIPALSYACCRACYHLEKKA